MDTKTRFGVLASSALLCLGVVCAPVSSAGDRPGARPINIKVSYAGIGYKTTFDTNGDGFPVDLSLTDSQGTLGAAKLAITTEWFIDPHECPDGFDVPFVLVNTATAYTFADQSQLFGFSQDGWLCANSTTGVYYGEEHGVYNGGTGRFEGATGEWTTKFEGATLDPSIDFRSIRGTAEGTLVMP